MARLAVNVDHVATVRQARGITEPDPVLAAGLAELAGAEGIICHLREDRRHIQDRDLRLLRETVKTKLNMEMAAVDEMVKIALEIKPDLVTLVPEKREELTTEGGLDVLARKDHYANVTARLKEAGIMVSFFIDPDSAQVEAAKQCGGDIVEIHTGHYAEARTEKEADRIFSQIGAAVNTAEKQGLRISAGHGLNYVNIKRFRELPQIEEYSIGHSIVARAVLVGFERAVREMVDLVKDF
ncbi:MAG: pyridoxine 5'-phosphate synthase [Deltaproteobacteria bacterium]|nr:pyridoxine 5'-phosphate synthase [Deltaproteobacteria bacterium]MBW1930316.1 pyridoxine 5'-phosphate synthase [Deltaproteobacteria bacterium]MBW2025282.1 pyridoxine 5'-phosphate synthase [Deltaproteobacteria bacterium]MBW2125279.1 pyridoxine 5'-phosphate synthase [Deltaproteobacteria bacterium]RLB18482.1 MAG: pyridoxine 5'-phosphate synthase [Deltaproteobacteria bacterium]